VGAAAGALVPPAGYFRRIREICDRNGVLFIADEVITGFGRIGRWFGIERFDAEPDIIVFAKGISAGYAPLGGIAVRNSFLETFRAGSARFEHNFTMAGHAVACAAGIATIAALQRDRLVERVAALESPFFSLLHRYLATIPIVGDIRGLGLLAGVELVADRQTKEPFAPGRGIATMAARFALDEGVLVYPCAGGIDGTASGDYLLIMPPFITSEQQLEEMAARLARGLTLLAEETSKSGL
jgi:adenosylmethionine-8-amino-7-oxononanoate aminotransferase